MLNTLVGLAVGFTGALLLLNTKRSVGPYTAPVAQRIPQLADVREPVLELRKRIAEHRALAHNSDMQGNHGAPCKACDLLELRLARAIRGSRGSRDAGQLVFGSEAYNWLADRSYGV